MRPVHRRLDAAATAAGKAEAASGQSEAGTSPSVTGLEFPSDNATIRAD